LQPNFYNVNAAVYLLQGPSYSLPIVANCNILFYSVFNTAKCMKFKNLLHIVNKCTHSSYVLQSLFFTLYGQCVLIFPPYGCEVLQSACLYVCLSVFCPSTRISHKTHVQTLRNFLYMLPVAVARSISDDIATRYELPVLWMTSRFHIMGQNQSDDIMFGWVH